MSDIYNLAIQISGPKIHTHDQINNVLSRKIQNLVTIGDGNVDLFEENGSLLLRKLTELKDTYKTQINKDKILVILNLHGEMDEQGNHWVFPGSSDNPLPSKLLFKLLSVMIKKPMDIIFTSCQGKGALRDVNSLPEGSRVMIFSDEDKATASIAYQIAFKAMNSVDNFSLESFYDIYLSNLGRLENPVIAISGGKMLDPLASSHFILGRPIGVEAREYVHNNFGKNICSKNVECHNKLDQLMNKMEVNSNIDDYFKLAAPMLSRSLLFSNIEQIFSKYNGEKEICFDNKWERIINDNCPSYFAEAKTEIDQYLYMQQIPLLIDLAKLTWADEVNNTTDENLAEAESFWNKGFNDVFDRGRYELIIDSFVNEGSSFTKSNSFQLPEYPEYGCMLGIAKDIKVFYENSDI